MKNKSINSILGPAAFALAGLSLLLTTSYSTLANDALFQSDVIPPVPPLGKIAYEALLANWYQWTLSFPANADPAADTAPQESNQSGPVWFLAGLHATGAAGGSGTVSRQITIPEGTALFFPVLSTWSDNSGCPTFTDLTVPELRTETAGNWSAVTETTCTIDGVTVRGLDNPQSTPYLIQSPAFAYKLAAHDNLLAADFGEPCIPDGLTIAPAVAEGVCLLVPPLPPGHHTIHFVGIVGPIDAPFVDFDETYVVTVKPSLRGCGR
ncbi:MAG TPA: hypothetical protein VMH87_06630 [Pseudomonadales bacterium]|nr:hypothetical protein [Pseudomonadales bacterium]